MTKSTPPAWLSPSWQDVFPIEDTKLVVIFLQKTWDRVLKAQPKAISYKRNREPKITQFLCLIMQDLAHAQGFYGKFDYEVPYATASLITGEVEDNIRTDIRYTFPSDKNNLTHELIFEFKKLKDDSKSRKNYFEASGMMRFISGAYRNRWDIACMVGLLTDDASAAVAKLKATLKRDVLANGPLHMQRNAVGQLIHEPSGYLPAIVQFDTIHSRALYGDLPNLLLCHFFLDPPQDEAET